MVADLKHVGTADWVTDKLKMSVKTSASSEEQTLKELCAASADRMPPCWLVLKVSKPA